MNEADFLWKLLATVSLLLGLAVAWKKVFFPSKLPQPLEVEQTEPPMSRREWLLKHDHFEIRLATLERRFDSHLVEVKNDLATLHEKINEHHSEIMRAIGRLEGGAD